MGLAFLRGKNLSGRHLFGGPAYPVPRGQGPKQGRPNGKKKGVINLADEIEGMACGLYDTPTPLPKDPVPGMAYVPYQQWSSQLLSPERALDAGTLFPILDKPFYGRRGEPR